MHSQVTVQLQDSLKLDPERPEYHRALVGTISISHTWHLTFVSWLSVILMISSTALLWTLHVLTFNVIIHSSGMNSSGRMTAKSTGNQQSSRLLSMSSANALLCLPQVRIHYYWAVTIALFVGLSITNMFESVCLICPFVLHKGHGQSCEWHRGYCHPNKYTTRPLTCCLLS